MLKTAGEPISITISTSVYRTLVGAYPPEFRGQYAGLMVQAFRDYCLKTYSQSGPQGMLALWAFMLPDWFKTVLEEQLNRGTDMTRTKFIRLSGWGLVLAAVLLLLTFLPEADKILENLYHTFGAPATSAQHALYLNLSEGIRSIPFPFAILLIILGILGLYLRYGEQAGQPATMALGIGVFGGMASLLSFVWMGRPITNIFIACMFAGLLVFGLVTVRVKPMPRGNALPALAGFWWPCLVIQAYIFPQLTRLLDPAGLLTLSITIFAGMSFFLALLGYVLQADAP